MTSSEVGTEPSKSKATASLRISAGSVCKADHGRKSTECNSYHITPCIIVTPRSSRHRPGSPEESISRFVQQFSFSGKGFCFNSQKFAQV